MRRNTLGLLTIALAVACLLPVLAGEGRTPIWAPGTVITAPGRYIVTRNITGGGGPIINVGVQNVDIDLNGMTLSGAGAAGPLIVLSAGGDVVIHDGTLAAGGGIATTTSFLGARVVLENLTIDSLPTSAPAIYIKNSQNFVVRRVVVSGSGGDGIFVEASSITQGTIEDNLVRGTNGYGIRVINGGNLTVLRNRVENAVIGISLETCESCLLSQSAVNVTSGVGILLRELRGGKVHNNAVTRAGDHGIFLDVFSTDSLIIDNVVSSSGFGVAPGGSGLFVNGERHMLDGNALNSNSGAGLRLGTVSNGITFGRNMARGNFGSGLGPCAGTPTLFPPNSCNDGLGNTTFGNNLIPGPPIF